MTGAINFLLRILGLLIVLIGVGIALALVWLVITLFTEPESLAIYNNIRALATDNTLTAVSKLSEETTMFSISENLSRVLLLVLSVVALYAGLALVRVLTTLGLDLMKFTAAPVFTAKEDDIAAEREPL